MGHGLHLIGKGLVVPMQVVLLLHKWGHLAGMLACWQCGLQGPLLRGQMAMILSLIVPSGTMTVTQLEGVSS